MMLKEAITIGGLTLKNRLVMPPMATAKSTEGGLVTDALISYYGERAAGGDIGLIITEHMFISQQGKASSGQASLADDLAIEGLKRLTETIRRDGTRVFAQINHSGSTAPEDVTGMRCLGPSALKNPGIKQGFTAYTPREMTKEEIGETVDAYVRASKRALLAGYDGVEIHCAHGYLLNQFYSPLTNHREDEYGGTVKNRMRITLEVLRGVRAVWSGKGPVAVRLGAADYMEGGNTFADAAAAAKLLEENGCDLIDVTGGMTRFMIPGRSEPGYFRESAQAVKEAVSVPVILTGGIKKASEAEELLRSGVCDLTGVGRALLADKDWARKEMR